MYREEFYYRPNLLYYNSPYEYPIIPSTNDHAIYEREDEMTRIDQFINELSDNWSFYLTVGIGGYLLYAIIITSLFIYYYVSRTRLKRIKMLELESGLQNELKYIRP